MGRPWGPRASRALRKPMTLVLLPHRAISEARVAGACDLGSAPEVMVSALALLSSPETDMRREDSMHNQYAGLTQALTEQRMTERQQQAADERLAASARQPHRRRQRVTRQWWRLARWPVGA